MYAYSIDRHTAHDPWFNYHFIITVAISRRRDVIIITAALLGVEILIYRLPTLHRHFNQKSRFRAPQY